MQQELLLKITTGLFDANFVTLSIAKCKKGTRFWKKENNWTIWVMKVLVWGRGVELAWAMALLLIRSIILTRLMNTTQYEISEWTRLSYLNVSCHRWFAGDPQVPFMFFFVFEKEKKMKRWKLNCRTDNFSLLQFFAAPTPSPSPTCHLLPPLITFCTARRSVTQSVSLSHSLSRSLAAALSLSSPLAAAKFNDDLRLAHFNLPSVEAEKLIRELNLFPKNGLNVIDGRDSSTPLKNKIVEKRFAFPTSSGRGFRGGLGPPRWLLQYWAFSRR